MTNLVYLGIAVVLSLVGCGVLWLRNRRPTTMEASIKDFSRELGALAPDDGAPPGTRIERPRPGNRPERPAAGSRRGTSGQNRGRRSG